MMVQRSFMIPTENGSILVKRIDKREARKRFYEGEEIYLEPCKTNNLVSKWTTNTVITNKTLSGSFDSLVNAFEYYNCSNETGTYASFYVVSN